VPYISMTGWRRKAVAAARFTGILLAFSLGTMDVSVSSRGNAVAFVEQLLQEVMEVLDQKESFSGEAAGGRADAVKKIIADHFDETAMAEAALGHTWHALSEEDRQAYTEVFEILFQDSYTRLVLDFLKREELEIIGEDPGEDPVPVQTRIRRRNDEIPVTYYVAPTEVGWKILDVDIDGVRIVESYRSAFSQAIQRESFEGFMNRLRIRKRSITGG